MTRGSRRSVGTRASPEERAISTTAVRPSPIAPQLASTGSPNGPGDPFRPHLSPGGLDERLKRAVAAVGDGDQDRLRVRYDAQDPFAHSARGFWGVDAALEGVGCDYYFHVAASVGEWPVGLSCLGYFSVSERPHPWWVSRPALPGLRPNMEGPTPEVSASLSGPLRRQL